MEEIKEENLQAGEPEEEKTEQRESVESHESAEAQENAELQDNTESEEKAEPVEEKNSALDNLKNSINSIINKIKESRVLQLLICLGVVLIVLIIFIVLFVLRDNELNQTKATLQDTQASLNLANATIDAAIEAEKDKTFDTLILGNSITRHPTVEDTWWGYWGMAASEEEKDFAHVLESLISEKYETSTMTILNFSIWERPVYNRDISLEYLQGYLNEDLDFIVIQLGENIPDTLDGYEQDEYEDLLKEDFSTLIEYIQEACPKADIVVVQNFWVRDTVEAAKKAVCKKYKLDYADLSEILGDEYRAKSDNLVVYGDDGEEYLLSESLLSAVAEHPGDKAMEYIAEAIFEYVPDDWKPEE